MDQATNHRPDVVLLEPWFPWSTALVAFLEVLLEPLGLLVRFRLAVTCEANPALERALVCSGVNPLYCCR